MPRSRNLFQKDSTQSHVHFNKAVTVLLTFIWWCTASKWCFNVP